MGKSLRVVGSETFLGTVSSGALQRIVSNGML